MSNESITFSEEQFAKLLEAIRPALGVPSFNAERAANQLALEILTTLSRGWFPEPVNDHPQLKDLVNRITKIAKEFI